MSPDPGMSPARFAALAQSYGADVARWPATERAAAEAFAAQPEERLVAEAALLYDAARLDMLLDDWAAPSPGAALAHRIAATAPAPRSANRVMLWWKGAGLAATGALGMMVGSFVLPDAVPAAAGDISAYSWSYEHPIALGEDEPA